MKRVKRRIFSGSVCEQIVYCVADNTVNIKKTKPRLRFKNDDEREKHRLMMSRRNHARAFNENFVAGDLYSTLTFDDEHEVHTFREARRLRDNYVRRLLRACPDAVIFIYMGWGKSTSRIHFHMVSHGIPEEVILAKWGMGGIRRVTELREHNWYEGKDHGQDFTGLANYLFDHWTPEQGGHRWKATRNARKPTPEDAKEVKRDYTVEKPPRAPKGYVLVEAQGNHYGYYYFKYVVEPPKRTKGKRKNAAGRDDGAGQKDR